MVTIFGLVALLAGVWWIVSETGDGTPWKERIRPVVIAALLIAVFAQALRSPWY
jgi:hypothetical protein